MAEKFDHITDEIAHFIARQHVFFVATAPAHEGHVNVSPKGYDTFRVLDSTRVAYLDLTGSGVETIAHLRHNGRITVMFCAFEGDPEIVRLYGRGQVIEPGDLRYTELHEGFESLPGERAIVMVDVDQVSVSCGWAVPFMTYAGERSRLHDEYAAAGNEPLVSYRARFNRESIDGLPALGDGTS